MYESLMHAIYHALVYRYMYGTRYQGYPDTIPVMVPGTLTNQPITNNRNNQASCNAQAKMHW